MLVNNTDVLKYAPDANVIVYTEFNVVLDPSYVTSVFYCFMCRNARSGRRSRWIPAHRQSRYDVT